MTTALKQDDAGALPHDEESVAAVVRSIIAAHLRRPLSEIPLDAGLENQLAVDSITMIDINISLEEHFGIDMPDMAIDHGLETVRDLARFISARLPAGPR